MSNLRCGGAEKSLISLLQTIDYNKYNVDLQLFKNEGTFFKQVNENVNILPPVDAYKYFDMSIIKAIKECLFLGEFRIIYNRIKTGFIFKTEKNKSRREQLCWKYISDCINNNTKAYDAAVAFLETSPIYYCIEKINSKKKIGFIHNDYEKLELDRTIDGPYYDKLDAMVTDSEECKAVLLRNFNNYKDKIKIAANIVSPSLIHKLSKESIEKYPETTNIISVGRFDPQKGYDLAIDALKIVKDKGLNFHWTILGDGLDKEKMKSQIILNNIQDHVSFLGIKDNHYPYVTQADIYMQTSRFEGKSIAIDEAKIMAKPILVTNFSTVNDQIEHNVTGIITEMNPSAIAEGIINLIESEDLRNKLSSNLQKESLGTEEEIENIYTLFQ